MSLQVWLPLNGSIKNNGVKNIQVKSSNTTMENSGKIGSCCVFNGSTSYVSMELLDMFKGGENPFSICFWIYSNESGTRGVIFGDWSLPGTSNFNIEVNHSSCTTNQMRFYWNDGNPDYTVPNLVITPGEWIHVMVIYDGSKLEFYKNNTLVNTKSGALCSVNKTSGAFYLGRDSRTSSEALNGKLNDFRIYDHALSVRERNEIYKACFLDYNFNQIDYVQNTSDNGYIDLGFYDTNGIVVEADVDWQTSGYFIGSHGGNASGGPYGRNGGYLDLNRGFWELGAGEVCPQNSSFEHLANTKYHVKYSTVIGNRYLLVNNSTVCTTSDTTPVTAQNVLMFNNNYGILLGGSSAHCKIYQAKIWDSTGTLRRNLQPTIRNGVVGFYDWVEGKFYSSAVSGVTFTGGTDGVISDASGMGNHGTLSIPSAYSIAPSDKVGLTALYTISGDPAAYIETPLTPSFMTNGSIVLWYKKDAIAANHNSWNFLMATRKGGGTWLCATSTGNVPFHSAASIGAWYVDGVLNANSNQQNTDWHMYAATGVNISAWSSFVLQNHGDTSWLYWGKIGRIQMFGRPLTQDEIQEMYKSVISIDNKYNTYAYEYIEE